MLQLWWVHWFFPILCLGFLNFNVQNHVFHKDELFFSPIYSFSCIFTLGRTFNSMLKKQTKIVTRHVLATDRFEAIISYLYYLEHIFLYIIFRGNFRIRMLNLGFFQQDANEGTLCMAHIPFMLCLCFYDFLLMKINFWIKW